MAIATASLPDRAAPPASYEDALAELETPGGRDGRRPAAARPLLDSYRRGAELLELLPRPAARRSSSRSRCSKTGSSSPGSTDMKRGRLRRLGAAASSTRSRRRSTPGCRRRAGRPGRGDALRRARRRQAAAPAAGAGGRARRCTAAREAALRAACAVELIHAYSLVHDDMPCMDNDVLRRGKPTVHVQFGEAQAMLAGDAMQALAFEVLTPAATACRRRCRRACARLLARAAGHAGMAGGQAIDLASIGLPLDEQRAARHAPPQDRRAAAGQRADGRRLRRRPTPAALAGAGRLRRRDRPGLPGGRRHPRRRPRPPRRSARPPARTSTTTSRPTSACSASTPARRRADELRRAAHAALAAAAWPTRAPARAGRHGRRSRQLNASDDLHAASNHQQPGRPAPAVARPSSSSWPTSCATSCCRASRRPAATCRPTSARSS